MSLPLLKSLKAASLTAAAVSFLSIAPVALAGPGQPGHSHSHSEYSAGQPGDPKKPARIVLVTMRETDEGKMIYVPDRVDVKRGEQVRFIVTNAGAIPHEFTLASTEDNLKHAEEMKKNPEMEHDDPNSKTIQPKKKAEIVWRFSKAGTFEFACLIPGHREAGMIGMVGVK
ncbi:MAG: cupredoxin domain-containing protein [Pseudomonadota bacterium]